MTSRIAVLCAGLLVGAYGMSEAATIYTDQTLSADCTTGNYSASARTCTGSDGNAYNTIAEGVGQLQPGSTLYLRGGTYTERIDLQGPQKQGTAGNYITVSGYPGEQVIIQCADQTLNGYGCVKHRGNLGWFIIQDLIVDGTGMAERTFWWIGNNNHDVIIRRVEVRNQTGNGFYITASTNVLVEDSYIHSAYSPTCLVGTRYHGFYVHDGSNITIRRNTIADMPGEATQIFPGPLSNIVVDSNDMHHNTKCDYDNNGTISVFPTSTTAGGGPIDNVVVSNNLIHHNGLTAGGQYLGGAGGGIRVLAYTSAIYTTRLRIEGNTIAYNEYLPTCREGGCTGYGIYFGDNNNGAAVVKNNILAGNEQGAMFLGTGNMIVQYNACLTSETCGTTGKVALTSAASCLVSTTDFRLVSGANQCVNVGTTVASRPSPVGVTDIGAFERGEVAAATALTGGGIEVEFLLNTQGVRPPSGPTGASVACAGCVGSPLVTAANVKAGSNNTLALTITGITSNGGCTLSLSITTTITDGGRIGINPPYYQPVNQTFSFPVNGTCKNSSSASSITSLWSIFALDDGTGTTANDSSGNGHHGTVSSGVTWVNDLSGTGVQIPTDATYRQIASTFGSGVNPTTQSFAKCVHAYPDVMNTNKVLFSSGANGAGQRWYAGTVLVNGQLQWGIGIQGSGFTTGSEFPVTAKKTVVCLVSDSDTDTAYLWVDSVKGAQAGSSVKTYTSYTLVGNLITGNDGTSTVNNGGFTVYEDYTWDSKPSDADLITLFGELTSVSDASACYAQVAHQAQLVYLDPAGSQINYGPANMSTVEVIDGGAVYLKIQINCTGSNGTTIVPTPYYSLDGTTFSAKIPLTLGAGGVAMWGDSLDNFLNRFTATCCISGALTANNGVTILTDLGGQAITLSQDHSYTVGMIVKFSAGQIGKSFWIKLFQGNGLPLAGGYTPSTGVLVKIVPPRSSGVF